jgi:nitrile hydratase
MTSHESNTIQRIHRELHSHLPSEPALRVKALESLLVEKGMVDPQTIDAWIEVYAEEIAPKRGAKVVGRAWTDPPFKRRLLEDGAAATRELGITTSGCRPVRQ